MSKYDRRMKKVKKFFNKPYVEETYALDMDFIEFIIPRLELFKEVASKQIVYDFTVVDKILEGFRLYLTIFDWEEKDYLKNKAKVQKSMWLFARHWMEFGW